MITRLRCWIGLHRVPKDNAKWTPYPAFFQTKCVDCGTLVYKDIE